jgi:surface carbohydrate biosynthesis protein
MLVDNKRRDLMVAALLAHHLEQRDVTCHLEPLEAYQGVLGAHRPDLIISNHLLAPHLVRYSQRLKELGVLVAVLPNEGILYDENVLEFNAGKHYNGAHIDLFFCWNEVHKHALEKQGFGTRTRIEVIGVPRFDFYFAPWSSVFDLRPKGNDSRPRVLFCTNFVFAKFHDLPKVEADRFFGQWKDKIAAYREYWSMVEVNYQARQKMFAFLDELARQGQFDIILRPHPSEDIAIYRGWLQGLKPEQRERFTLDQETNITQLILNCDVEVSCETCTTALESWIAKRPTVELVLERHPVFFHPNIAALNTTCERAEQLVDMIRKELSAPRSETVKRGRGEHLAKWCHSPNGTSTGQMADAIVRAIRDHPKPDWSKLGANDRRRAMKLRVMNRFGQAYHFDPLLPIKRRILGSRYQLKSFSYRKSITPRDVTEARAKIERGLPRTPSV